MACRQADNKPLPKPMMTQFIGMTFHHSADVFFNEKLLKTYICSLKLVKMIEGSVHNQCLEQDNTHIENHGLATIVTHTAVCTLYYCSLIYMDHQTFACVPSKYTKAGKC